MFQEFLTQIANVWTSNSDALDGLQNEPEETRGHAPSLSLPDGHHRRRGRDAFSGKDEKMCFHSNVIAGVRYHGNHSITCRAGEYRCLATLGLHVPPPSVIWVVSIVIVSLVTPVKPPTFLSAFERTRPVYLTVCLPDCLSTCLSVCPSLRVTVPCYLFSYC